MSRNTYKTVFEFVTKGVNEAQKDIEKISKSLMNKEQVGTLEKASEALEKIPTALSKAGDSFGIDEKVFAKINQDFVKLIDEMQQKLSKDGFKFENIQLGDSFDKIKIKYLEAKNNAKEASDELGKFQKSQEDFIKQSEVALEKEDIVFKDEDHMIADKINEKIKELKKGTEDLTEAQEESRKKQIEILEAHKATLAENKKVERSLIGKKGGTVAAENKARREMLDLYIQETGLKKVSEDAMKGLDKTTKEHLRTYNALIDAHLKMLKLESHVSTEKGIEVEKEHKKQIEEKTKEIKALTGEVKKLDKQEKHHEQTMARKIASGLSYYTIFNQIKRVLRESVRVIRDLDKAMTQATIVSSLTTKETWKLLGSYQALAKETGKTTTEIAELNAFFLQQGKSIKQAAEMTEAAAKSAAVAGTSLQEAANYITSAIHGFNLAASEAENVADKFAALGASTASSFEEIAIAMSKVAPVAQSAGVGIDFMMGILAKGIHTTREAPEAIGTAMKTIFARMRELTDIGKATEDGMSLNRVEKALNSINVDLRDVTGQFRNLEDVLIDVGMKWDQLNTLEQAYLATALAGTRQQPRLLAILNDFDTTMEMIETSKNAEDELMYQHMDYMEGMEAATNNLRTAWEAIITSVVDSEIVIGALNKAASLLEGVAWITDKLKYILMATAPVLALVGANLFKNTAGWVKNTAVKLNNWAATFILNEEKKKERKILLTSLPGRIAELKAIEREYKAKKKVNKETGEAIGKEAESLQGKILAGKVTGFKTEIEKEHAIAITNTAYALGYLSEVEKEEMLTKIASAGVDKVKIISLKELTSAAWKSLGPYALIAAALFAIGKAAQWLIKRYKEANRSVEELEKSIQKSAKTINESTKKMKGITEIVKEFKDLQQIAEKTNEEMDRFLELAGQLEDYEGEHQFLNYNILTKEYELDNTAVQEYQLEQVKKIEKEREKQMKEAQQALAKDYTSAMKSSTVLNVFKNQGREAAKAYTDEIENLEAKKKTERAASALLDSIDPSDFMIKKSVKESYLKRLESTAEAVFGSGYGMHGPYKTITELDETSYKDAIRRSTRTLAYYISANEVNLAELIDSKNLTGEEALYQRLRYADFYHKRILETAEANGLEGKQAQLVANAYKSVYQEEIALYSLREAVFDDSSKSFKKFLKLTQDFEIDLSDAANVAVSFGFDLSLEEETFEQYSEKYREDIESYFSKQSQLDLLYSMLPESEETEEYKQTKSRIDKLEKDIAEMNIPELDLEKTSLYYFLQDKDQSEAFKKILQQDFKDIDDFIKEAATQLEKDLGIEYKAAESKVFEMLDPLTTSSDVLADKTKRAGELISNSLKITDEVSKGDFSNYFDLISVLGKDAADELIRTGKLTEEAVEKITGMTQAQLENRIDFLEGIKNKTAAQEEELIQLTTLDGAIQNLASSQELWNKRMEETRDLMSKIESTSSFIEDLSELGVDLPKDSFFHRLIEFREIQAFENLEGELKSAAEKLEKQYESLKKVDGQIIYDGPGGMVDQFEQDLENFEEASQEYLQLISKNIDRERAEKEKEIKMIEETHRKSMDALKKEHDERWRAIDYENKLLDLQEKVTAARNKLAATMFGGDAAGQKDAQKTLREAREARQKEIETQILDEIQRKEEEERDRRVELIQEGIKEHTQEMAKSLNSLLERHEKEGFNVLVMNPEDMIKKEEPDWDYIRANTGIGPGMFGLPIIK